MAVPFAKQIAAFNRRVTNPILDPIVWFLPGYGRVETIGRQTGRRHVAPMMGFPSHDGRSVTFALTYGPEANWVRNAVAAGRFWYRTRTGGIVELVGPTVYRDARRGAMPRPVRLVLRLLRVEDFLVASVAGQAGTAAR
ncbi:MAG TPA: hypothetical protein VFJ71_07320 [Candidatus Limnocylindrales bacterium]|nr:hypothetical protein [Candidatus Limnocylindrales bacterium]